MPSKGVGSCEYCSSRMVDTRKKAQSRLDLNHHFAKVATALQELERLLGLVEGEGAADDRADLMRLVESNHLLKSVFGAIDDPLQSDSASQRQQVHVQPVIVRVHLARDVANAVDQSTKGNAIEALPQSLGSTRLENDIGAVVVSPLHHLRFPARGGAVVDGEIGTELFGLVQFRIGGRSDDGCQLSK